MHTNLRSRTAQISSRITLLVLVLAPCAAAQSFNVDFASLSNPPVPSSAYGAAAGQPGHWNVIDVTVVNPPLLGLGGAATAITLTRSNLMTIDFGFDSVMTQGDDGALMDDGESIGGPAVWTFSHLSAGDYAVYTYAWASDSFTYRTLVSCGSQDPDQIVGGTWPGHQQAGVTYALHHASVPAGGSITIRASTYQVAGTINGFQLVRSDTPAQTVCVGDGSGTACPCGNAGGPGRGCANSVNSAGARLDASGTAWVSGDSFVLSGSGMPNGPVLYIQGSTAMNGGLGVALGDGLRCAGGLVVRLGTKSNVGGASSYPQPGDTSISVRGAVVAGGTHTYQAWYRNAATYCTADTFNLTNGLSVIWMP
ncbi:MAG: hypothetical protein NTY35_03205 [Planctomycetota bacterium]|nr:hypothetical protein [Planctomycetota bacterium]